MGEFDRLNQGDPDVNLRVVVTKCSGEQVFLPSASSKKQIRTDPCLFDDFMSGMGIFDEGGQGIERIKQGGVQFVYYKSLEHYYRI